MLAREMEMGLLELKRLSIDLQCASRLGNDFDRCAKVLELGSLGEVGDGDGQVRRGDQGENTVDHVDGRLFGATGASFVHSAFLERRPEEGSL